MVGIILAGLSEESHVFIDAYVPKRHLYQGKGNLSLKWLHL